MFSIQTSIGNQSLTLSADSIDELFALRQRLVDLDAIAAARARAAYYEGAKDAIDLVEASLSYNLAYNVSGAVPRRMLDRLVQDARQTFAPEPAAVGGV